MLKVLPSKFIPGINAGHKEYISKREKAGEESPGLVGGLGVTLGHRESEHVPCGS